MMISDIYKNKKRSLSFEIFPPKKDAELKNIDETLSILCELKPDFISVTFGAGGSSNCNRTIELAKKIKYEYHVEPVVHLTCLCYDKAEIDEFSRVLMQEGMQNILALRGDIPKDDTFPVPNQYKYACELIEDIKSQGDFCIGAACYPEGHVESACKKEDIIHLKNKVECGVDFLTTQMFFDNSILYNFLYRIREQGITVPVLPGIMPVTNGKQMKRICDLSGTILPQRFRAIVDCFGDNPAAMQQAGIAYATDQIIDLIAKGIRTIHIYSMNKPEVAAAIMRNLS